MHALAYVSVVIFVLLGSDSSWAATQVSKWNQKTFRRAYGAIYLDLKVPNQRNLQRAYVHVKNIASKKTYVIPWGFESVEEEADIEDVGMAGFSQDLYETNTELSLYSLPAGRYRASHIKLVYGKKTLKWQPKAKKKSFIIKDSYVSNVGIWILKKGKKGYTLNFNVKKNAFEAPERSAVKGVINGFSGIVQKEFKDNRYKGQKVTLGSYSYSRTISMYYSLNLLKHNQHNKKFLNVIKKNDPTLRSCYTDHVDGLSQQNGDIRFVIAYSGKSKSIRKATHKGGSIKSPDITQCLYERMQSLKFPITQSMIGRLTFFFKVIE